MTPLLDGKTIGTYMGTVGRVTTDDNFTHYREPSTITRARNRRTQGNDMNSKEFDQMFPLGEKNDAYAQYFTGQSYLAPLTSGSVPVSNVSFEPGCRNNWHVHHGTGGGGDQILLCTAGSGWYQAEGEDPVNLEPGTVIRVPAGTKHWHGAKADSWFSHVAFITPGEDLRNEWLEPVTDEVYGELPKNGENA